METKVLTAGIVGFLLGGLVVSVAATQLDGSSSQSPMTMQDMPMGDMSGMLTDKYGDDFDQSFLAGMIEHHEGAIEMAKLAPEHAKHDEIKQLSSDIVTAQEREITQMKQWQSDWGYESADTHQMHQ